ncbi:chorismate synthase [Methanimicrococcus blatticola]|uniref:Chorismate synthase n=1 Tax=Methanimicrococcus blatticola TaxID=91560 RepID=A0A484F3M0_9EURY|nr:chorismate synthase [Methanimicrococcus blatticola]MBZ3935753.1 chorismate synthase [Methanimicrococcus blatticola]MCC2508127.1 chorismate synthase [Methanimicrococcus blatticola]TDQ68794.1 chorismate synthase [Methanimicrococcus blatticola]
MAGNTFGNVFRITTWGESHGPAVGVVIDGAIPGIAITAEEIQKELDRRKPGQSDVSTSRKESDTVEILSGVFEGKTTGTPISLLIRNTDQNSSSYDDLRDTPRPGHADFGYAEKYGIRDHRGGGRSSGRETAARVAAGAVAKKILTQYGIEVVCHTVQIGKVCADSAIISQFSFDEIKENIETNPVRCADSETAAKMEAEILAAKEKGDSVGGIVEGLIRGVPAGLGEPVFDKLDADLAKAIMSIGAVKGFEIGGGFDAAACCGSEFNDAFEINSENGRIKTVTNNAGGILGGISTGETIRFRAAIKPTPSVSTVQKTVNLKDMTETEIVISGRHDPVIAPRFVPVGEAMAAIVILDHLMRNEALHLSIQK